MIVLNTFQASQSNFKNAMDLDVTPDRVEMSQLTFRMLLNANLLRKPKQAYTFWDARISLNKRLKLGEVACGDKKVLVA